jgi:hypothetical protein
MNNVEVSYMKEDLRPAFILNEVKGAIFRFVKAMHAPGVPTFVLNDVEDFTTHQSSVPDTHADRTKQGRY